MHNRLKIKTTAEQEAAKKLEQEKKLKIFKAGTMKIFDKRERKEYDEEALSLTGEFLAKNPDFYSLWNFRREILIALNHEKSQEDSTKMGTNELMLTQTCLKKNPKSYWAWNHRFWSMEFFPGQDWDQELKLCNMFLSMDERNFHCWDYRRQVIKKCHVDSRKELEFTSQLIERNFSNYSAWHYRSTLLPIVHPGPTHIAVDEQTLLKEYETVQNAAFTDPNDQSVWFYHRWLLGRGNDRFDVLSLAATKETNLLTVLLSCPVKVNNDCFLTLKFKGSKFDVVWRPVGGSSGTSTLWTCEIPSVINCSDGQAEICLEAVKGSQEVYRTCIVDKIHSSGSSISMFSNEISSATKEVLEKELESCKQLYEMEPDNKWTIFTCMLLMKALDSKLYHNEICGHLDSLTKVDEMRANYYYDLRSKTIIEDVIMNHPIGSKKVSLSNLSLTSLPHFDHFHLVTEMDLSFNKLSSLQPLCYLLSVEILILDDNRIENCDDIKDLKCLRHLSLKNNCIASSFDIQSLKACENLQKLFLDGNPIASVPDYRQQVKELLGVTFLDGEEL